MQAQAAGADTAPTAPVTSKLRGAASESGGAATGSARATQAVGATTTTTIPTIPVPGSGPSSGMSTVLAVPGFLVVSSYVDNTLTVLTNTAPYSLVSTLSVPATLGADRNPMFMAARPKSPNTFHLALYSGAVWELSVSATGIITPLGRRLNGISGPTGVCATVCACVRVCVCVRSRHYSDSTVTTAVTAAPQCYRCHTTLGARG